jgi:hypothetical protein|tara:strand:+ start:2141 stop:2272 length:132 start_codon:yes stop_codon:yes gene_type:complete
MLGKSRAKSKKVYENEDSIQFSDENSQMKLVDEMKEQLTPSHH